jgi:glutathione-regulated potassium-efflux system ancillary protein KefG
LNRILILFAHPALQKSRVNKVLIQDLDKIDDVSFRDLYQIYPELDIDVASEQYLLLKHDVIIFHHPFFWYSTPAILKEWQDLVLQHGWAYGSQGTSLKNKLFFSVVTSGGRREAYCKEGYNNFTIRQLLAPLEQTARLCKMIYLPPFVVHGTHSITPDKVRYHKSNYEKLLVLLRDNRIDVDKARSLLYLNDYLDNL